MQIKVFKRRNLLLLFLIATFLFCLAISTQTAFKAKADISGEYVDQVSVTLDKDVSVNYSVSIPQGYTDLKMVFTYNGKSTTVERTVSETSEIVSFEGVMPNGLGKTIMAELTLTGSGLDTLTQTKDNVSVKGYCEQLLTKTASELEYTPSQYTAMQKLVVDLMYYGDTAQSYTNVSDELVTKNLTDEQKALKSQFIEVTTSDKAISGAENTSVIWKKAGLALDNKVYLYLTFQAPQALTAPSIKITKGQKNETVSDFVIEEQTVNEVTSYIYKAYYQNISLLEFDAPITATVYDGETAVSKTLTYSVKSYVYAMQNQTEQDGTTPTALSELVKNVSSYGKSAEVFKASQQAVLQSISVNTQPNDVNFPTEKNLEFRGLTISANYDNGESAIIDYSKCQLYIGDTLKDWNDVSFTEGGEKTLTVKYKGFGATFSVTIYNGYIVEAENIITTANVTDADKYYIEKAGNYAYKEVRKDTEPASAGAYMGEVKKNAVIKVHIWSDVARTANVIMRASSGVIKSGDGWAPSAMYDLQLNQFISATNNGNTIAIDDSVILPGGETADGSTSGLLWVNWVDVTFGTMNLYVGDNVIEVTIIGDKKHETNTSYGTLNIDRFEVVYSDNMTFEMNIDQSTKSTILANQTINDALVVKATYSDSHVGIVDNRAFTFKDQQNNVIGLNDTLPLGLNTISVYYNDTLVGSFEFNVIVKYIVEAETIIKTANITDTDKYFIENSADYKFRKVSNVGEPASNDAYMGDVQKGQVIKVHIWSDYAVTANVIICASSGVIKSGDGWAPSSMKDIQLNTMISAQANGTIFTIEDTVILPGGATEDGSTSGLLWVNWQRVDLGEFNLIEGDNVIEITVIGNQPHGTGVGNGTINIDYFEIAEKEGA